MMRCLTHSSLVLELVLLALLPVSRINITFIRYIFSTRVLATICDSMKQKGRVLGTGEAVTQKEKEDFTQTMMLMCPIPTWLAVPDLASECKNGVLVHQQKVQDQNSVIDCSQSQSPLLRHIITVKTYHHSRDHYYCQGLLPLLPLYYTPQDWSIYPQKRE